MRALTYVNGKITVLREDGYYCGIYDKPGFITGENFYYERTLKQMDESPLNQEMEAEAEAYITSFVFPTEESLKITHLVNTVGEYTGMGYADGAYIAVSSAPSASNQIWDFVEEVWYEACVVDKDSGKYLGAEHVDMYDNGVYVPSKTLDTTLCTACQSWDFVNKTFTIDIEKVRSQKIIKLNTLFGVALDALAGIRAQGEMVSWTKQEAEARAYMLDNTTKTPFIDALLLGRGLGETKEALVALILAKADAYEVSYASLLGKFHAYQKNIESASSLEVLKAIVITFGDADE